MVPGGAAHQGHPKAGADRATLRPSRYVLAVDPHGRRARRRVDEQVQRAGQVIDVARHGVVELVAGVRSGI